MNITHKKVITILGDVASMDFCDNYFDLVLCAEVLEHIPPQLLETVCNEIIRVTCKYVIIGVPYKQDIRIGSTFCSTCNNVNPPWGHVNSFDEEIIRALFTKLSEQKISYVGKNKNHKTTALSHYLMTLAGHPYGTYDQKECCIYCGKRLTPPAAVNIFSKLFALASLAIFNMQSICTKVQPNWVHILFRKQVVMESTEK